MNTMKICLVALMAVAVAVARPQNDLPLDANGEPFDPNPVYTYSYQVSDDDQQTYMAKTENRDGDDVTGEYSYVDALGQLVTVTYTAGAMGYSETREVTPNFVEIRSRPAPVAPAAVAQRTQTVVESSNTGFSGNAGFGSGGSSRTVTTVQQAAPIPVQQAAPVARVQETVTTTSDSSNSDLIARILAQLTPLIQSTVSNSLTSNTGRTTTTRRVVSNGGSATGASSVVRRVEAAPAPVVQRTVTTSSSSGSDSAVSGIFGISGANNIRFTNPDISYGSDF